MLRIEFIGRVWGKLVSFAEQLYTPKELKAILLFLGLGIGVLVYRSGSRIYHTTFPEAQSTEIGRTERSQDSLFHALTAQQNERDSLFFSIPEDSLLPRSVRARSEHHSKEESLTPHSIVLTTANKEDLMRLPGVGAATAETILAYRSERGFRSLDELENVHGIGRKKFSRMARFLRLH